MYQRGAREREAENKGVPNNFPLAHNSGNGILDAFWGSIRWTDGKCRASLSDQEKILSSNKKRKKKEKEWSCVVFL